MEALEIKIKELSQTPHQLPRDISYNKNAESMDVKISRKKLNNMNSRDNG